MGLATGRNVEARLPHEEQVKLYETKQKRRKDADRRCRASEAQSLTPRRSGAADPEVLFDPFDASIEALDAVIRDRKEEQRKQQQDSANPPVERFLLIADH